MQKVIFAAVLLCGTLLGRVHTDKNKYFSYDDRQLELTEVFNAREEEHSILLLTNLGKDGTIIYAKKINEQGSESIKNSHNKFLSLMIDDFTKKYIKNEKIIKSNEVFLIDGVIGNYHLLENMDKGHSGLYSFFKNNVFYIVYYTFGRDTNFIRTYMKCSLESADEIISEQLSEIYKNITFN